MSEIVMPRLSDTMEEGTILRWLKHDGEHVARGEELVEIETDKAAMTYESDSEGTLQTLAREGDTLAVGAPIARIGEQDGDNGVPASDGARRLRSNEASTSSRQNTVPPEQHIPPTPSERIKASPLARRVAHESGVELRDLTGTGPRGRIVKADVETSAPRSNRRPRRLPCQTPPPPRLYRPGRGGGSAKGETTTRRALAHAAHDRAAHGRVQGDDPRLHTHGRYRHGALRRSAR